MLLRSADDRLWNKSDEGPIPMHVMTAKLAGRRHHAAPLTITSVLTLSHEKTNPVDRYAVAVYAEGEQIGYLESGLAHLVAPMLDRGRPVFASAIDRVDGAINLFVPSRGDRIGQNIVLFPSSDGVRSYAVDRRTKLCTCPAGRFVACRHKVGLGLVPAPVKAAKVAKRAKPVPAVVGVPA